MGTPWAPLGSSVPHPRPSPAYPRAMLLMGPIRFFCMRWSQGWRLRGLLESLGNENDEKGTSTEVLGICYAEPGGECGNYWCILMR